MWGMRDKNAIETYGKNIIGVHQVIPKLLEVFRQYNVRATFASVGFILFESKEELVKYLPEHKPEYTNVNFSPYDYINNIGIDFTHDRYHYAPMLVKNIQKHTEHEIGTHTFSHYYCLEEGQTIKDFEDDLKCAVKIANSRQINVSALVFPRNQFNDDYLQVCKNLGIICYRGNQFSWIYTARNGKEETLLRRGLRLIDAYINISGNNCYSDGYLKSKFPVDIPASRFLRPYSKTLKYFDWLRLRRIKSEMTYAAKKNRTYHLWWHPHNFGINQDENFAFLNKILTHYQFLNKKYNFQSYTMSTLARELNSERT
jgi:peptidoglycan/xylan/chitin deacetylase (PgdA/CDA1 family)